MAKAAQRKPAKPEKKPQKKPQKKRQKRHKAPHEQVADENIHVMHSTSLIATSDFLGMFNKLVNETPRDDNGFLTYFLDAAHIPPDFTSRAPAQKDAFLDTAKVKLSTTEGYPAFDFTHPTWNQLPHEPDTYYFAFRAYCMSPARSLEEARNQLPPGFTPYTLEEAYYLFYWRERAKAFDILRPVAAARLKDQRIMLMEDSHYVISNRILETLTEEIEKRYKENEERPWQGMDAKDIVKSITTVAEMQRTALGLPAKGPRQPDMTGGYIPQPASAGMDRGIRQATQNYLGTTDIQQTQHEVMQKQLQEALAHSPESVEALQKAAMDVIMRARAQKADADNDANDDSDNDDTKKD